MNKNGFTLIELLAVIIILSVVTLIATPMVLAVVDDAGRQVKISEINMLINSASNTYAHSILSDDLGDSQLQLLFDGKTNVYDYIKTSGEKPKLGDLKITSDGNIAISIFEDGICYTKGFLDESLFIDEEVTSLDECVPLSVTIFTDSLIEDGLYIGSADLSIDTNGNMIKYCISEELGSDCTPGTIVEDNHKNIVLTQSSKICVVGVRGEKTSESVCNTYNILRSVSLVKGSVFNSLIKSLPNYSLATKIIFEKGIDTEVAKTDLSLGNDNSIIGFVDTNYINQETGINEVVIRVQSDDLIMANADSSSMFADIYNVETIDLSENFNTSLVTSMTSMFKGNNGTGDNLSNIIFGNNFNTYNVVSMNYMFSGLDSMVSLTLPEEFNTIHVKSMSAMLSRMTSLTNLNLGDNFNTSNVTDFSWMFNQTNKLTTLDLGSYFDTSNAKSMSRMFVDMASLETLNLGDNFNTSGVTDLSSMFSGIKNMEVLYLGDKFNTSSVTTMGSMFAHSNFKSIEFGLQFNTENVTNMSYMFYKMPNIEILTFNDLFNTSKVTNMTAMFSGLSSLNTLNLGNNFNTSNVVSMNIMFENTYKLLELDLGNKFVINENTNRNKMFLNSGINKIYVHSTDLVDKIKGTTVVGSSYDYTGLKESTIVEVKS